ncbi:integrase catalytic domain-containing protein [Trichonephila clavipes]|nr:integrase catalytic domain-containing protein [Trichonephila clavipes]
MIRICLVCKKYSAKPTDQLSGQLPRDRITQSPPFQVVGIDFTGAILVKDNQGTRKSYVSLFTCAVTRAVHLELVSDMSTKCFLLALWRFLARRGNCKVIYSDNARTFKAAERELAYFANILKDSEFQNFVADKGIHWKFIVERAPWWGGFYERLVKTIKDPLRKILGRALLTFEELSTILSEVEVIVNHRPLTYVENDPGEPEPLTPAHFLKLGYGDSKYPIHFIELIDATTAKETYKKRKTYRTLLKQLWRRWKEQYLLQLKTANHFKTPSVHKNLKLNDVVLVEGNVKSKLLWELGIIKEVFIGRDDNASFYVDDLQINCEGSDMRMIKRQLQNAVNNIVKWCDTNGHSISASKSCCVHFCRKRGIHPDSEIRIRDVQIPVVPDAIVLSRIDYGCVVYGLACNSTLKRLDPVHHMALRICSGAFRASPVQSLYVNCNKLPLDLRRRKLSLASYFKILSVPSHPLQNVYMITSMKRLYDARPSNIRPFMDRMKLLVSELDLPNVNIQQRNLLLFQPWNTPRFHYINSFASYSKSIVTPVIFQRVFTYHRSQYSRYSAIYTDGLKRADYVGCGVVIEDVTHGYRLDPSCSVFTAEAVAIYRALQSIDSNMPRKYCIYTDSMSVLEAHENYNDRCHPVVCNVLDITSRMHSKGFDIVFCWLPSHVGIIGNEQTDSAARSATTHLPLAVPLSDIKRAILHHIFKIWQESWSLQLDNKLHSVKPVIGAWPMMPMRRTDVRLTRLRICHTRFTHRHLLLGEDALLYLSCKDSYTVKHILVDCPVFLIIIALFFLDHLI